MESVGIKEYFADLELNRVAGMLKNGLFVIMLFWILVYLLFFLPISYIGAPLAAKKTWDSAIYLVSFVSALAGGIYTIRLFVGGRDTILPYYVFLAGFAFLYSVITILSTIGLLTSRSFMPIYLVFPVLFIGYLIFFGGDLLRKYDSYLAKSLHFVEAGTAFFLATTLVYLVTHLEGTIHRINSFSSLGELSISLSIVKLVAAVLLIHYTRDYIRRIKVNESRRFLEISSLTLVLVILVEAFSLLVDQYFDLWWAANLALLMTIFFVAQNPTKRKSYLPVNIGAVAYFFLFTSYSLNLDLVSHVAWGSVVSNGLSLLSLVVGVLAWIGKKWGSGDAAIAITESDVRQACAEIIDKEGFTLRSINDIVNISIVSREFEPCKEITEREQSSIRPDLFTYLHIYLLCAEYAEKLRVEVYEDAEVNNRIRKPLSSSGEFKTYVSELFPKFIPRLSVWQSYNNNEFIRAYISRARIESAKPATIIDKAKKTTTTILTILVLLSLGLNQVPISILSFLPNVISTISSWHKSRITDLRLSLSESYQPYKDQELKSYYAVSMKRWADDWGNLHGQKRDHKLILSNQQLSQNLHWVNLILSFHEEQDWLSADLNEDAGNILKALEDCESATKHYEAAISSITDEQRRDWINSSIAKCYCEQGDFDKALEKLNSAPPSYLESRLMLAEVYCAKGMYNRTVDLVDSFTDRQKSNPRAPALKAISSAEIHYAQKHYELAVEDYYRAVSILILKDPTIVSDIRITHILGDYKSTIDQIYSKTPHDPHLNAWYLSYCLYTMKYMEAVKYYKALEGSNDGYARELMDFFRNLAKKNAAKHT